LRKPLFANQTIISEDVDKIILSTQVAFEDEILNVVRQWIPHIKIVEPQFLKDNLKNALVKYLDEM
jgi:predicted DNA-binding transcriptional regulator YafY